MKTKIEALKDELTLEQFPLSSKYDIEWINENEMGPNSIWLSEFLLNDMNIEKDMRILDLGCGKAISSIFIANEFKVQVWATDLWINATDNFSRIIEFGLEKDVFPIHADAHNLPYADNFFDAIVSIDAYHYFGTDEMYLNKLLKYLKPGGQIGIVVPGVIKEFNSVIPKRLEAFWEPYLFTHHGPAWWKALWNQSGLVNVETADLMNDGYKIWLKWDKTLKESGILKRNGDVALLEADGGNFTFTRVIAKKNKLSY